MVFPISFDQIPAQMIIEIFLIIDDPKNLGRIEQVCKLFKNILDQNPSIWEKHLLKIDQNPFNCELKNPKDRLICKLANAKRLEDKGFMSIQGVFRGFLKIVYEIEPILEPISDSLWNLYRSD